MDEQNIPIDIAVRKLGDWLVSRRICNRDWHQAVVKIREKIGEAMQDMPENEAMVKLLRGTHLNYFHCLAIIHILKETEASSKNFFGQYGSKRMKDWTEIVGEYQVGSVYLAEAAQLLVQNVVYEIPGLKKQIAKCETVQVESDKKVENSRKRIGELEQEYKKHCTQLGIQGERLRSEIIELAKGLPETYERIAEEMKELAGACDIYEEFVRANLDDDGVEERVVTNLRFLIENGNVTTYQWKYGEKPISVEPAEILFGEEEEGGNDGGEIDFGDGEEEEGGEIDFGDTDGDAEIDFGDEIDFGGVDSGAEIDFGSAGTGGGEIDFDIDTSAIVVEEGGMAGGVARDEEALSLLDNRRTRTVLLDELEELTGFLTQRLHETETAGNKFSLGTGNQNHDPDTLRRLVRQVESVVSQLTEVKMQQLQMIRGSPSYADRLADSLKQKLKLVEKVHVGIAAMGRKKEEAESEQARCQEQVGRLLDRTRDLQAQIEADISGRYKGRPVHITGTS